MRVSTYLDDWGSYEFLSTTVYVVLIVAAILVAWNLLSLMHGETRTGEVALVESVATSRGRKATVSLEDGSSYELDCGRNLFGTSKEAPEEGMLIECQVSYFGDEMYSWEQLAEPMGEQ